MAISTFETLPVDKTNGTVQSDDLPSGACDIETRLDSDALEVVEIA